MNNMEWKSVKDNPPKKPGRYLVFEIKGKHTHNCMAFDYPYPCCKVNIAYCKGYSREDWSWNSLEKMKCNPTHWAELPEKPEE